MNFFATAEKVLDNVESAFIEHEKQLKKIRDDKLKFFGKDITSFLAIGGISIAAAIIAHPALGAAAACMGLLGVPNLRELHEKFKELRDKSEETKLSPVGLLFKHRKNAR
jgi:hypothetical protein